MIIGKKKSPLKDTGKGRGHALMTKKQHVDAHDGDVESAGYEEEAKDYTTMWRTNIPPIIDIEEETDPFGFGFDVMNPPGGTIEERLEEEKKKKEEKIGKENLRKEK